MPLPKPNRAIPSGPQFRSTPSRMASIVVSVIVVQSSRLRQSSLCLLLLTAACSPRTAPPQPSGKGDRLFQDIIDDMFGHQDIPVIVCSTTCREEVADLLAECDNREKAYALIWDRFCAEEDAQNLLSQALAGDFVAANVSSRELDAEDFSKANFRVVPAEKLNALFDGGGGWRRFHQEYSAQRDEPDAVLVHVSIPGFNAQGDLALLVISWMREDLEGGCSLYLARKAGRTWTIVGVGGIWDA